MKKICVVTATRAEYGLLKNTINCIYNDPELELCLLVTGAHLLKSQGETVNEIMEDGFPITEKIEIFTEDNSESAITTAMGKASEKFGSAFEKYRPDMLVVLGDRYELLPICGAALIYNIPITHISGGEITEGAIDDSVRHAVTKLSNLHFPGCEEYRDRIIRMGEEPDRVFNYGDVGIENIVKTDFIPKEELLLRLGVENREYCLVTFHPVTMEKGNEREQMRELLDAISSFPNMQFIFTKANMDAGGNIINEMIDDYAAGHDNCYAFTSLGSRRYLSLMKKASCVIGNSSSGIVEAPAFHIPTVNVGNRQKGRIRAGSVIDCECGKNEIVEALKRALSDDFTQICRECRCPFGEGDTSVHIVDEIKKYLSSGRGACKKFYDFEYPNEPVE